MFGIEQYFKNDKKPVSVGILCLKYVVLSTNWVVHAWTMAIHHILRQVLHSNSDYLWIQKASHLVMYQRTILNCLPNNFVNFFKMFSVGTLPIGEYCFLRWETAKVWICQSKNNTRVRSLIFSNERMIYKIPNDLCFFSYLTCCDNNSSNSCDYIYSAIITINTNCDRSSSSSSSSSSNSSSSI